MATVTGPLSPTVGTDLGDGGDRNGNTQSGGGWTSPGNIIANDGAIAYSGAGEANIYSGTLVASGFNFGIPAGATIVGIKVEIKLSEPGLNARYIGVRKTGTTIKSTHNATNGDYRVYGSETDLWGASDWTAADINAASFGCSYGNDSNSNGGQTNVDHMRITVYWDAAIPVQQAAEVPVRYVYKVYNRVGKFLGKLPTPKNKFKTSQEINTAGVQITVEVPVSADTSRLPSGGSLLDESGAAVTDESNDPILTESAPTFIALGDATDVLIKNGNRIVVWEYTYYYPNGRIAFNGTMERWEAVFGGEDGDNTIDILCYSDGADLDNYLLLGSPYTYVEDVIQTNQNGTQTIFRGNDKDGSYDFVGQSFKVGNGVSNIGGIRVPFTGAADVTLTLYNGADVIAVNTQAVNTNGGIINVLFPLSPRVFVSGAPTLFFTLTVGSGQSIQVYRNTNNVYANGTIFQASYAGGSGGGGYVAGGGDLWFITYSTNGSTAASFPAQDPARGMLLSAMGDYNNRGGRITATTATVDATGISVPYQLNTATMYEAIQAFLTLAPFGFYYYVNISTNLLYFKKASTTADIILVKGKHLASFKLAATIEHVSNVIPFTGGETSANVNFYKTYTDAASVGRYGQRLDRRSDINVTTNAPADAIGTSAIAQEKNEQYQTTVKIPARTMDITKLLPGKVIGFRGFGTFVDTMLLLIVRVEYEAGLAVLTLGYLPPTLNQDLEQVTRNLIAQETIYNPASSS